MEKISEMIERLCPEGVEQVLLGELGEFENIGVDKKTVQGEQEVILLNYVDVYRNKYINSSTPTMIVTASDKKRTACNVLKGDIFVTPTSETVDDIGHSSVATEDIPNCVYSYHIMRFRQKNPNDTTSFYINYLFDLVIVKQQILKKAQGLTRFGLSKDKFASIEIPLPPLPIQQEIVRILDSFTSMITNLETELASRQKQYEYYRNKLLTFDENDESVEWKILGDCCKVVAGGTPSKKKNEYWENGKIKWLGSTVCQNTQKICNITGYITEEGMKHSSTKMMKNGTTLIALVGATIGKNAYLDFDACINRNTAGIFPLDNKYIDSKYLWFFFNLVEK